MVLVAAALLAVSASPADEYFVDKVAPIFETRCLRCHHGPKAKGSLDLSRRDGLLGGGDSGAVVEPGKANESLLIHQVSGDTPEMPKGEEPLSAEEVSTLRRWIDNGAHWPAGVTLKPGRDSWWSLQPIRASSLPRLSADQARWVRTPIDGFILSKLQENSLAPSREADRYTLIRRLYFDLIGLPPSPGEVDVFLADRDPRAYEKLVDRLLESQHYGERWARHWLDVVHYGDTHGFDKDKVRPNAWPYRDYVIRSFNDDKPYSRFVREQLAGDYLFPNDPSGIVATGFIAAGPFDWVGQIEVREGTVEKARVRNLDRDDMVTNTMSTFCSLTVHCARCHDHKFDPITQEDYYSLQAVFADVDRADRTYELDARTASHRAELARRKVAIDEERDRLNQQIERTAGPRLAELDKRLSALLTANTGQERAEFGFHSAIETSADIAKWVQVDLGKPTAIASIAFVGCHDDFAGIGAGFGFPPRYKIEISKDREFKTGVELVLDRTRSDVPNPGIRPQAIVVGKQARFIRFTATKLAERKNDYIFALAELFVFTPDGANAAANAAVTSIDSIEAPVRWRRSNLVDGYYYRSKVPAELAQFATLSHEREQVLRQSVPAEVHARLLQLEDEGKSVEQRQKQLPAPAMVFAAATDFPAQGAFQPTKGVPRSMHVLARGEVNRPLEAVGPGAVACLEHLPPRFRLRDNGQSAATPPRAALAEWIVHRDNPLTWRSIVNRVWQYHFGRGLVETPDDFGRMGARPTHPELLDWLAADFKGNGESIKRLHRLICASATYRQVSSHNEEGTRIDAGNRFLWRMNRRRLEAECIRDAVLAVSGKLDPSMFGPGFQAFGFKDDHSPHYLYEESDPDDRRACRRSIYRFLVRSVPDPFMETLDCADPSQAVGKRNETLTSLQALALLNNKFMIRMAEHFADRVAREAPQPAPAAGSRPREQVGYAYRLAFGRSPADQETAVLVELLEKHGLANVCRLLFNTNEFVFVD